MKTAAICGVVLAWAIGAVVHADIINVPGDQPTIQAGINAAANGDVVIVADGTYTGPGNRDIDYGGRLITVRSLNGPDNCIIDCNGNSAAHHRGFVFQSGETPSAVLNGFTIRDGFATDGGAMFCNGASPTVGNCVFENSCGADNGGAIYNTGSCLPAFIDCTFSGNFAEQDGGGMYNDPACTPTLTGCTFDGNGATRWGGGMYNNESSPTLTGCTFTGNNAFDFDGGAMYNFAATSAPIMTDCIFSGNSAASSGGAINNVHSSPSLVNCVFVDNTAQNWGGAIFNFTNGSTVTNCTFSGNAAFMDGGGVYNNNSSMTMTNSIIWGDSPNALVAISIARPVVSYSDIQGGVPAGAIDAGGNIAVDPLLVGVTGGDLRLLAGSPCIDAGDNTAVPAGITTDLDGSPRFVQDTGTPDTGNPDGVHSPVDMGAYEFCRGDANRDGTVDVQDLVQVILAWGARDTGADTNADGVVDVLDLVTVVLHWGPCS